MRGWIAGALAFMAAGAAQADDGFIAGYATAVLERELGVGKAEVQVKDGAVAVIAPEADEATRERIQATLGAIRGVTSVRVIEADPALAPAPPPAVEVASAKQEPAVLLPRGRLFKPLLADPRWPHFAASYLYYFDDEEVGNVGAVSFGESFGLFQGDGPFEGRWELGFQAAVFAIFDLDAESKDLINADYFVGVPISYRVDGFSAMARLYHQSSHLGDEFLLRNRVDRVNLSYEAADLKLSFDLPAGFRIYGGGQYLLTREPDELDPWSGQAGLEFVATEAWWNGALRPIAGVDLQSREESGWGLDVSLRGGVQLENPTLQTRSIQLLVEYYHGSSPNGQFYDRDIEYLGLGAHVQF
jgi:hypothetical protein